MFFINIAENSFLTVIRSLARIIEFLRKNSIRLLCRILEKFAELFIENYFSKSIGSAWSAFIDQQTEMDDDFNTIYVWENVKHGYRLKLHSVSKSLSLNAIAKESDISFD